MRASAASLLLLICGHCAAQSVPAKPTELDVKLKAAYVSYLKTRSAGNPPAKEICRFYAAHPDADLRFPDAREFSAFYAGPATPPLELIRAYYDPRLEVVVVPRTGELEAVKPRTLPSGPELEALLAVRANDILHESYHAMLDKTFGFKVINIMEDELLANWREAQYLARARPPAPELSRAADDHLRSLELKKEGLPPEKLAALERREAADAERWGPDALDGAIKVVRLKRGAAFFKRSILELYGGAGQGKPSIFLPRAAVEARLREALERKDLGGAQREVLQVELSFWSRPDRVDKVRDYFRKMIPELLRD
ncbi:MAG: hypothetical protein HY077_11075 [Elusimicrobia bacterium]|nr:hypothetical protein [Elusimicrobiota bacterium]